MRILQRNHIEVERVKSWEVFENLIDEKLERETKKSEDSVNQVVKLNINQCYHFRQDDFDVEVIDIDSKIFDEGYEEVEKNTRETFILNRKSTNDV